MRAIGGRKREWGEYTHTEREREGEREKKKRKRGEREREKKKKRKRKKEMIPVYTPPARARKSLQSHISNLKPSTAANLTAVFGSQLFLTAYQNPRS